MPLYEARSLFQTAYASLAVDSSTSSTTFIDLLTLTLTTSGGNLMLLATFAAYSTSATDGSFQITLDGVAQAGSELFTSKPPLAAGGAITVKAMGIAPGSHTVTLQWKGSLKCRPVAQAGSEHAALRVEEVFV